MHFYTENLGPYKLSQGDLLYPIYFTSYEIEQVNVYNQSTGEINRADFSTGQLSSGIALVGAERSWGLVTTQGCDLDSGANAIIVRVRPIREVYPKDFKNEDPKTVVEFVKKNFSNAGRSPRHFYMPAFTGSVMSLPISAACLLETQSFSQYNIEKLSALRRATLSADALTMLQEKLAYCFCRFGAPEHLCFNTPEEWQAYKEMERKGGRTSPEPSDYPARQSFIAEPASKKPVPSIISRTVDFFTRKFDR